MTEVNAQEPGDLSLLLDDQMCFALYAASRAVTGVYRPLLAEFGLTYPQYLVMLVLWEHGAVPVKVLGGALQLDYGTLSPLLKRLEADGMVRRERRADDERSVLIALTDEGAAMQERVRRVPGTISAAMGLDAEQFDQLRRSLRQLTANILRASQ